MDKKKIPVLVGAAQLTNREKTEKQKNPVEFMAEACRMAAKDAAISDLGGIDTICIVNCLSRILEKPGENLAKILGIESARTNYSTIGGVTPQWFVNENAEKIYTGKAEVVLICGAESFYTKEKIPHFGTAFEYYVSNYDKPGAMFVGDKRQPYTHNEIRYGLTLPIPMYAMVENALRAHWGKTMEDHMLELSSFCSDFSKIASKNQHSWSKKFMSAKEIATPTDKNKMVVFPYTKAMCANMSINQAAAVIMTNLEKAEAYGISKDKMIFLRGSGAAEDNFLVSERPELWASPSVSEAVDLALNSVPVSLDEIPFLDFYSCFPCVPRIVREMLKISPTDPRPLTVTGGLASFGGAGNNYTMHAICQMMDILREKPESFGMIHAISWFLSKHSIGIYNAKPGEIPWTPHDPKKKRIKYPAVNVVDKMEGKGTVESFIVKYDRDGQPNDAVLMGRDQAGNRFIANVESGNGSIEQMTKEEPIGKMGDVKHDSSTQLNRFYFK